MASAAVRRDKMSCSAAKLRRADGGGLSGVDAGVSAQPFSRHDRLRPHQCRLDSASASARSICDRRRDLFGQQTELRLRRARARPAPPCPPAAAGLIGRRALRPRPASFAMTPSRHARQRPPVDTCVVHQSAATAPPARLAWSRAGKRSPLSPGGTICADIGLHREKLPSELRRDPEIACVSPRGRRNDESRQT